MVTRSWSSRISGTGRTINFVALGTFGFGIAGPGFKAKERSKTGIWGARLDGVEGSSTAQELVSLVVALMMALARGQIPRQLGVRSESFHVRS